MRSALYYPHTHIQSEALLRTALLLWDNVAVVAPYPSFVPDYEDRSFQEAFEIIGRCHYPTEQEKRNAHELIEDFATRTLPKAFYYDEGGEEVLSSSQIRPYRYWSPFLPDLTHCRQRFRSMAREGVYEIYAQKLLPETWALLREAGMAGSETYEGDVRTPEVTGLGVMSLLADCCAGETLTRVTDREAAYAAIANLFTTSSEDKPDGGGEMEGLAEVALATINLSDVPLHQLIDFRKEEEASATGHSIRDLRHSLLARMEAQSAQIEGMKSQSDREQLRFEFEADMRDDLASLRSALRLEAWQVLGWKELSTIALAAGGLSTMASLHPTVTLSYSAAAGAIIGLLATGSKFVRSRQKVLKDHPMAYLYELAGGVRL